MSIVTELAALAANKAAIKAAIEAKNPATAPGDALADWPAAIASIPTGGGAAADPDADVVFVDCDGTPLHSYTAAEAQALAELPPLPEREGLTCQEWNYTLAQMKSCLSDVGRCVVGATYTTDDGKTRIVQEIPDAKYADVTLYFRQTAANGVTVDWGDGSASETFSDSGETDIAASHTYAPASYPARYTVTFNVSSGTMSFSTQIMGAGSDSTTTPTSARQNIIKSAMIGSGVTSIGTYAFRYCYTLASLVIPSGVTSIGISAFNSCHSLASLVIPSGVTSIGSSAFNGCYSLASLVIPSGVTTIENSAFAGCSALRSFVIPSGVTTIEVYMFSNCYALASLVIPSGVTSIGNSAFRNCKSLASLVIPSGVTTIEANMFSGCSSLASLVISSGVTSVMSYAFNGCYGCKTFDFRALSAVPALGGTAAFTNTPTTKEIIVPDALYDDWVAATNWSSTANNIKNCIVKASESSLGPLAA